MAYEIILKERSNGRLHDIIPFESFSEYQETVHKLIKQHGLQEVKDRHPRSERRYAQFPHAQTGIVVITRQNYTRPETRALTMAARLFK